MVENSKTIEHYITNANITSFVLGIISDLNCSYFNAKKIRHGLYKKHGIELRGRPSSHVDVSNDLHLKMVLSCRIGHITRKLKKCGYIKKFNRNTWKRIKEIDINDPELYPNGT